MIPLLLFTITFVVYFFSNPTHDTLYNYFVILADAFLHGHLYIAKDYPWLNELVGWQGYLYVVYPPMPAILLTPFVAIFGLSFPQPILSSLIGAVNVSIAYLVLIKIFKKKSLVIWVCLLYAFGTMQWYHAETGSAWYFAHIVTLFFLWLALLEIFSGQRLILIGFLIGCAYLARLPAILSIVFVLLYFHYKFIDLKTKRIFINNFFLLGIGLLPAVLFNWEYNYLRFGVIYDISYNLLPVFNEPWYRFGLLNVRYIPTHLQEIFIAMPKFIPKFPFVIPSLNVMALWFVTPVFLLIPFAKYKEKIVWVSLLSVLIASVPSLMHGQNGFTQFGFRFALDYLPFLLLLTASGINNKFNWITKLLIVLSILINLWGIIMINFLHLWTI